MLCNWTNSFDWFLFNFFLGPVLACKCGSWRLIMSSSYRRLCGVTGRLRAESQDAAWCEALYLFFCFFGGFFVSAAKQTARSPPLISMIAANSRSQPHFICISKRAAVVRLTDCQMFLFYLMNIKTRLWRRLLPEFQRLYSKATSTSWRLL